MPRGNHRIPFLLIMDRSPAIVTALTMTYGLLHHRCGSRPSSDAIILRSAVPSPLCAHRGAPPPTITRRGPQLKRVLVLALLAATSVAQAEPSSAKQALINKILKVQQPAIEGLSRSIVEQPAAQIAQQAGAALQTRVPAERRDAVGKEIQGELKKYVDEATPLTRDRALKLAPTTIGKLLDEKFTEKELQDLLAIIESPVNKKFVELAPTMQRTLGEALVADTRPSIEPKLRALEKRVAGHLGIPAAKVPNGGK